MAASLLPFPNDSFHLLGFFMTVGIDAGTRTGGSGGALGSDWRVAEAEHVWWLSPCASICVTAASCSISALDFLRLVYTMRAFASCSKCCPGLKRCIEWRFPPCKYLSKTLIE